MRSRVLALGVAGVLLAGGSLPLIPMAVAQAQGKPSAGELLTRGQGLLAQGQYATAKRVLLSVDPSQLTPVERTTLEGLLEKADVGLAASAQSETIFHNAQTSFHDGHLAHAASLYQYLATDTNATPEIRREAKDNLALTQAKQKDLAPAMDQLLHKAIAAYNAKNYDQAEADLYNVRKSGVDLGADSALPAQYENLIAQQRVAAVNAIIAAQQAKVAAAEAAKVKAQQEQAQAAAVKLAAARQAQQAKQQAMAAAKAAQLAKAKQEAAAEAAQRAAEHQAALAQAAAAAHKLAMENAAAAAALAAHEAQVEQQLAQQQNQQEAQRQAQRAAAALAAQQKAQQEAAAAKLAAEQKAHAAAAALAAHQKAEAAALAARQAAQEKAAQEAAREKAAQELAAKKKLQQQKLAQANQPHQSGVVPNASTPANPAPVIKPAMPLESPAQVNAERASLLVVEADDAVKAAKYQNAITLYSAALALDPQNVAARMGRQNAQKLASGQSVGLLSQTIYNNAILAQRAQVMFDTAMHRSAVEMQQGHYARALNSADNAEATATSSRHLLTPHQYDLMISRSKQQVALVQQEQAAAAAAQQKIRQRDIQASQIQLEEHVAAERRIRINELMRTANGYYKQQQYQHALDTLNQVVAIDPHDYSARFMRRMVQDQIQYNKYNHYANKRSLELQKNDVATEEETIPYQRLLIYPRDWPELSRMRAAEMTSSESPLDRKVEKRLGENVPKISASAEPFENVIDLLRNQTGLNIVVNWNALGAAGVEKTTPVSITLRDVPFKKILQIVLQQVQGAGTTPLGYSVDQGVITISSNTDLALQKVVRVYDIQDLLVKAPSFTNFPQFNLQSASQNSNTSAGTGTAGAAPTSGNLFGGGGGGAGSGKSTTDKKAMVSEIEKLIENTVDRNTWTETGGTVGSIREISGQLVVSQTPATQQKVAGLLQQLRESRAIQISIEARFLLVGANFLNDFAFGWNLSFPTMFGSGIAGPVISDNTASIAAPQSTGIVGSLGGNGSGTGSANPANALDISGGILSNYQLNLFLQATQEDVHTTTVTAPRITLFNGQQAYITVAQQQNFVSSFTQTVGTGGLGGAGGVGTNLNISTLTTGVVLAVQATVSADHRYVVMTLQPSLSTLNGLQTFNISGQSTESATTSGIPLGGGFVQLPNISLTELATTVSVPDNGTLLIGGQRLVGEVEVESGVPILSKIPIINRLFTNRSYVRDTKVLLILVRPHIIIQKEAEKKQFGQNY